MSTIPVLVNGKAGSGRARAACRQIASLLSGEGAEPELLLCESREQALEWSKRVGASAGLALVAGGDGTLNSVLAGFCNQPATLGLIPLGTGNCLARELGIPLSLEQAVHTALHGVPRAIDMGLANGNPFAVMAGVGFDAEVVAEVSGPLKNLIGPWAYVVSGLEHLLQYRPRSMQVEVDGTKEAFLGWLVVLGNASVYAYRWRLGSHPRIDDGLLDVCLFPAQRGPRRVVDLSAALVSGDLGSLQPRYRRGREVTVWAEPPAWVQVDGDALGRTPVTAHVVPGALKVMVPHGRSRDAAAA